MFAFQLDTVRAIAVVTNAGHGRSGSHVELQQSLWCQSRRGRALRSRVNSLFGRGDASVTRYVGGGGIDVESNYCVSQVKNYVGTVGIADVRQLAGVVLTQG